MGGPGQLRISLGCQNSFKDTNPLNTMAKICSQRGCNRPAFSKGMCRNHYDKLRKRTFFSLAQRLRGPYRDFKKDSILEGDNANLNELIKLGLYYVRAQVRRRKDLEEIEIYEK